MPSPWKPPFQKAMASIGCCRYQYQPQGFSGVQPSGIEKTWYSLAPAIASSTARISPPHTWSGLMPRFCASREEK